MTGNCDDTQLSAGCYSDVWEEVDRSVGRNGLL